MFVILGGNGYVGSAFQRSLSEAEQGFTVVSRDQIDYSTPDALLTCLRDTSATFVINAAGYTGRPNVDACELHKAECLAGNAVLPGIIREVCEHLKLPWGHVSSGCIYTGSKPDGSGFTEEDAPNFSFRQNNCSFYSGCKALGEEVLAGAEQCFIWRLRIPFDEHDSPRNYISKMMRYDRLLSATNSLSQLTEFADACIACWTKRVDFGTWNLTNPGCVTTREVVDMITRHGLSDKQFSFFESEQEFMQQAALTPRSNCVLDVSKAMAAGLPLSPVHEAVEQALINWKPR
ncbi:MAG TPA: NAD-dependent epimerase/dehydratase family protein [Planctomycetes bacterium]|nr:NAD-dependent epimerase/dehydratase family protein [Fuerstiella sp.]HIK94834.1 NAD-dependent epimerase/dehydratase family protein [Planctomycetota bacterium]